MLSFLRRKTEPVTRRAPDGLRIYAVGDVHGRLDALDALLTAVREDSADGPQPVLVMLGDYVDRGPASRQVLDRMIELKRDPSIETRFIRGNHDDTLLKFLSDASLGPTWCKFGGRETLLSYGVLAPGLTDDLATWEAARDALVSAMPPEHFEFLCELEPCVELGDYFFTHAGVRPGVSLADQSADDLMWIREQFLRSSVLFPKTIVHGHTPEEAACVSDRRIGLDTGAYATGRLTAVVLEGTQRRLIQAIVSSGHVVVEAVRLSPAAERQTPQPLA